MMSAHEQGVSVPDVYKRLRSQVAAREGVRGQLNPTWVEWLMGFPLGWTDLKVSVTQSFRLWLRGHGKS